MTAALVRLVGDISDTHHDRCCTGAAAVAPLTLREGLLPSTYTNSNGKALHFRRATSPFEKRIVRHKKPRIFPQESLVLDRFKQQL